MKWKELKESIDALGDMSDYEVDIVGENSGSWGAPLRITKTEYDTPDGEYREINIYIDG